MSEMEEKLGSILSNPQLMQQIMSMAQALGQSQQNAVPHQEPQNHEQQKQEPSPLPNIDPGMLQKLSGFSQQGNITKDEQALLRALSPYLSRNRISKLEKAMRAAKIARLASSFLNAGGLQLLTGR